jgi:hypothetical protein
MTVINRWSLRSVELTLSADALEQGLWRFDVDLSTTRRFSESDGRLLGPHGRLSYAHNPRTDVNPHRRPDSIDIATALGEFEAHPDTSAKQSCLFDLERLVAPPGWHSVRVVAGGYDTETSAFSSMLRENPRGVARGAIVEIWDPFFGALKYTSIHLAQLDHTWEADLDLLAPTAEHRLGLA